MNLTLKNTVEFDSSEQTILVIDDNPINLKVIAEHLETSGFEVSVAQDGEGGLKKAQFIQPDLILLDVKLPRIDGFEVCRRLKATKTTKNIPVIFMTVLIETEHKLKGFQVGAVDYITKPFQQAEVLARITAHLRLRELTEQLEQKVQERTSELAITNQQLHQINDELARQIAERKQAEESLRQSEDKYRSLITNIPDVIWTTNYEGRTTFISPNIETVHGYTPEEIYKSGDNLWLGRIHPDDVENVIQAYTALFEKETKFDIEYRIQRKDGQWIWAHDRAVATYKKDGTLYADGVFVDITKRKQAEDELREHRNHLEELVAERTAEQRKTINLMAGREVRMAGLKKIIKKLHAQLQEAGLTPVADDTLDDTLLGE